jgi:hemoglobin
LTSKTDISSRSAIESFVSAFYEKVKQDDTIGIIFTEIVQVHWESHIPLIVDFWETILLDNPIYKKNAMEVHYHLNNIFPLQKKQFDAWLHLFNSTIDEMYEGKLTELAKKRAAGIAAVMLFKMNNATL